MNSYMAQNKYKYISLGAILLSTTLNLLYLLQLIIISCEFK